MAVKKKPAHIVLIDELWEWLLNYKFNGPKLSGVEGVTLQYQSVSNIVLLCTLLQKMVIPHDELEGVIKRLDEFIQVIIQEDSAILISRDVIKSKLVALKEDLDSRN